MYSLLDTNNETNGMRTKWNTIYKQGQPTIRHRGQFPVYDNK